MPASPADPVEVDVVRPRSLMRPLRSPDRPEPDVVVVVDAAGDARLCSVVEISCDNDACELPAEVPAAWVTAALCTADPAGLVVCGAEVNGVTSVAAAQLAAEPH